MLATTKRSGGMPIMPATRGITARTGPKKRPKATLLPPYRRKKSSPRVSISGWRLNGQAARSLSLKRLPAQKLRPSPATAPATAQPKVGQKSSAPVVMSAPAANIIATPGIRSPTIAIDSEKLTANTTRPAQKVFWATQSISGCSSSFMRRPPPAAAVAQATSAKAAAAASRVSAMMSSVWAPDTKPASKAEGAR